MVKLRFILVAAPAFLLGIFTTGMLTTRAEAKPGAVPGPKWEYRVVTGDGLMSLSMDGWEYCGEFAAMIRDGSVDRAYTLRKRR